MKKVVIVLSVLVLTATLSGCKSEQEHIVEKAKLVKTCTDNGGEWYNNGGGFGPTCHFDTRKDK